MARGWRALVRGGQPERLEALDDLLWTWRDDSFLPHAREDAHAARQPIVLTERPGNPNGAKALFLIDGAEPGDLEGVERACLLFDGRDEGAVTAARLYWKKAKDGGHDVSYWKEAGRGRWEKQT